MKYVVVLIGGQGRPLFLVDDNEDALLFDTEDDADMAGKQNTLGRKFGFEIMPWEYFDGE